MNDFMNILQTSQNTIEIISKANDQYITNKVLFLSNFLSN